MRIMALDVGDRRIGVAISDPMGLVARRLTILERDIDSQDVLEVMKLVEELNIGKIVVGIPLSQDGGEGQQARKVNDYCALLRTRLNIPLETMDERYSTLTAQEYLKQNIRLAKRKKKQRDDSMAAAVILQDFLDENT
ncbi:MAG: Holliday junction resolvase RuvX [Dehalococcoidia bacterium]|nr:Holliday junction resolvase RuvX [Dehalococcoidia bacterium]